MNKRFHSLPILALLLPLALVAPNASLAQTDENSRGADARDPARGDARHQILHKLGTIRMGTVAFDGLPFSEVVRNLNDEAKRLDPAKVGINFLINPNPPRPADPPPGVIDPVTGLPPGPVATEMVDINTVSIRISPALSQVTLGDLLDAIVLVADHPIRYSVTGYGVVFSLGQQPAAPTDESFFTFDGGTLRAFLKAVDQQCNVNWSDIAEIPDDLHNAIIPKLRINQSSLASILGDVRPGNGGSREGGRAGALGSATSPDAPLRALVALYNSLGDRKPELGHLIIEGNLAKPAAVLFVSGTAVPAPELRVKAFSIKGIPEKDWPLLSNEIEHAAEMAQQTNNKGTEKAMLRGHASINRDTNLLIATGSPSFIDMVESIVAAFRANEQASDLDLKPPKGK